ncbi:hypothetical protein SAMN05443633_110162 [Chryseobacterium arachidis]|uniref:Uncharacterized protein n=1 Tax=Chryseobacterium arachidis TaxID=1416778 RepID=A0A1M5HD41_9FLAO|nr:hypothetical protein [Chryseobacterium arachidis]SHG13732.1 hypothetical protein SAMN05443633_110162 [Chryseobacterium arachidis]
MIRTVLAVIAGIIVGSIGIWLMEILGHSMYPYPAGLRPDDLEGFKAYVENLPFMGKFMVILGYALGALISGFVSTKIANNNTPVAAVSCGIIFLFFTIYNMIMLPTPAWFWVLGIAVWGLVLAGYKLALNKNMI